MTRRLLRFTRTIGGVYFDLLLGAVPDESATDRIFREMVHTATVELTTLGYAVEEVPVPVDADVESTRR
jgi:hypothetical protein